MIDVRRRFSCFSFSVIELYSIVEYEPHICPFEFLHRVMHSLNGSFLLCF